jgi:hypothetical protein
LLITRIFGPFAGLRPSERSELSKCALGVVYTKMGFVKVWRGAGSSCPPKCCRFCPIKGRLICMQLVGVTFVQIVRLWNAFDFQPGSLICHDDIWGLNFEWSVRLAKIWLQRFWNLYPSTSAVTHIFSDKCSHFYLGGLEKRKKTTNWLQILSQGYKIWLFRVVEEGVYSRLQDTFLGYSCPFCTSN